MLYRRERRFSPWLVALATAALVLPLGFWLGHSSAPEPTITEVLQPSLDLVRNVNGALDIVLLEYKRAHSGNQASLEAAASAVRLSEARLESAALLSTLYPAPYKQALGTLQQLGIAVASLTPVDRVEILVKQLRGELNTLRPHLSAS